MRLLDNLQELFYFNAYWHQDQHNSSVLYQNSSYVFLSHIFLLPQTAKEENHEPKWLGKTNFVEIRSFWQIFRSFDRMWSFFILSLQVFFDLIKWCTNCILVIVLALINTLCCLSGNDYHSLPWFRVSTSNVWCGNIWGHYEHLHYLCFSQTDTRCGHMQLFFL